MISIKQITKPAVPIAISKALAATVTPVPLSLRDRMLAGSITTRRTVITAIAMPIATIASATPATTRMGMRVAALPSRND